MYSSIIRFIKSNRNRSLATLSLLLVCMYTGKCIINSFIAINLTVATSRRGSRCC